MAHKKRNGLRRADEKEKGNWLNLLGYLRAFNDTNHLSTLKDDKKGKLFYKRILNRVEQDGSLRRRVVMFEICFERDGSF